MKSIVAAFAGGAGSGKSTLATRVAQILGWPHASFGDYVRAETARRGLSATRENWQNVGLELVQKGEGFCRGVIAQSQWQPGRPLILEGLRHPAIYDVLCGLVAPADVLVIYLQADARTREQRLHERNRESLRFIESHPVEKDTPDLLRRAAIVVDASRPESELVDELVETLTIAGRTGR